MDRDWSMRAESVCVFYDVHSSNFHLLPVGGRQDQGRVGMLEMSLFTSDGGSVAFYDLRYSMTLPTGPPGPHGPPGPPGAPGSQVRTQPFLV